MAHSKLTVAHLLALTLSLVVVLYTPCAEGGGARGSLPMHPRQAPRERLAGTDVAVLRVALAAETLEAAFYNWTMQNTTLFSTFSAAAKQYVPLIYAHEHAHEIAIKHVLGSYVRVKPCADFPFADLVHDYSSFLDTALAFENLGVSLYDYAAQGLSDPSLLTVAATVATIEGRHATVIGLLKNSQIVNFSTTLPGNVTVGVSEQGFDAANSPTDALTVLSKLNLLTDCSSAQLKAVITAARNFKPVQPQNYNSQRLAADTIDGKTVHVTLKQNDINVLIYASVLEALESTFYEQVKANFSEAAFVSAGFPSGTYTYMTVIAAHETAHYEFLNATLGASTPKPCKYYNWANNTEALTPQQVVALANVFETTGVSAYDGAINAISSPGYVSAAATIATVEARHSTYLRNLTSFLPGNVTGSDTPVLIANASFDTALTPSEIVAAITPFLTYCTLDNLPRVLPTPRLKQVRGA